MYADNPGIEATYKDHFALLTEVAVDDLHIAPLDAEEIVHQILLASLLQKKRITNMTEWLTAALRAAAECHLTQHGQ